MGTTVVLRHSNALKKTAVTGNQTQTGTKIFAQKADTVTFTCIA